MRRLLRLRPMLLLLIFLGVATATTDLALASDTRAVNGLRYDGGPALVLTGAALGSDPIHDYDSAPHPRSDVRRRAGGILDAPRSSMAVSAVVRPPKAICGFERGARRREDHHVRL